jgi:predicted nucleic acid-binding protein
VAFPPRLVTDTCVLIDLSCGQVLEPAFRLPADEFAVPDVVLAELEGGGEPQPANLIALGLKPVELTPSQVLEAVRLAAVHQATTNVSIADVFALALAKTTSAVLLTGDSHLRSVAEQEGVEVHGTLWVLDQLVEEQKLITAEEGAFALSRMKAAARRLPKSEVDARQLRWGGRVF